MVHESLSSKSAVRLTVAEMIGMDQKEVDDRLRTACGADEDAMVDEYEAAAFFRGGAVEVEAVVKHPLTAEQREALERLRAALLRLCRLGEADEAFRCVLEALGRLDVFGRDIREAIRGLVEGLSTISSDREGG